MEKDRIAYPILRWDTGRMEETRIFLPPAEDDSRFLELPVYSSLKSMLVVDVVVMDRKGELVHEIQIVVEWAGMEHLYLLLPEEACQRAHQLVLRARDYTYAGTELAIGTPVWRQQRPLIPVNAGECLLDMFTSAGYYRVDMWTKEWGDHLAASTETGFLRQWNYAQLRLAVPRGKPNNQIAYSRVYDQDISGFQSFIVCVSVDPKGRFSLHAEIDGKDKLLIDNRKGSGMEEIRVPIRGNRLQGVTVELASGDEGQHVAHLYWFMLERKGTDPCHANEIRGMPDILDPGPVDQKQGEELPLKLLFDEEGLAQLRHKITSGTAKRFYEEILAEAEANLEYRPESFVGTYFPVYWGKQGIERPSVPYERTRQWFSTLIYNSLAYLLGGELKYGLSARRALLAAIECEEWCGGFLCRIPRGITGYRAPFTEAHLMQAVALCYDFVGKLLTAEERRAVEDAVYEKAIPALDMYLRRHREGYLLESNQGTVYSTGILYACLVAGRSHPDVKAILERQAEWCLRMIDTYYKQDGTTGEGMMYWEYTTHYAVECLMLIARYQRKPILDIAPPQLGESMNYVQHMRSLDDTNISFLPIGDCRPERFRYMGPSFLFFARFYEDESAYWMWRQYYDTLHPPGNSFYGADNNTGQYTSNALLTLLLYEDRPVAQAALPDSRRFDCDRVFWRTGSRESDLMLFFEGGRQSFEHAHFDKGQFIIQAFGEFLAADPGMIDYSKTGHVNYVQSAYHNIVTVRGQNQSYRNAEEAVRIRACEVDERFHYLRADLMNSYKELDQYERTLLFVRPDYFLVLDDLISPTGGIEWNFHSRGVFRSAGDNRFIAEATKAGLLFHYACNVNLDHRLSQYEDEGTIVSHNLVLSPNPEVTDMSFAALMVPYPNSNPGRRPLIESTCESIKGGAVFSVAGPWGNDTIVVRMGKGPVEWNDEPITDRIRVIRHGEAGLTRSFR